MRSAGILACICFEGKDKVVIKKPTRPPFIGWATIAYPTNSDETYRAMLEKQRSAGANFVWIGHNNPGIVEKDKDEPGLSYSIYEEATDPAAPNHESAKQILDAQIRFLEVCRELSFPVVFPIGYQIQMGVEWQKRHPEHLRRDSQGKILDWGGISASCYSPQYRKDITRYYQWVVDTIVKPYRDILLMINLSDEPFGGDYSYYAEQEFKNRQGFGFGQVGDDPERQRILGEFQSDVVVDYACWSAEAWHRLCPEIPSTISFCGSHGREENIAPTVLNLFRKTPPHFEITFDLYPRDGPFDHPITPPDISALWIFLTQIGELSYQYRKPIWMWPTGNSWGTGQESSDRGHVSDAVANIYYNVDRVIAAGGQLKGAAIWNFNCVNQGLFNDPHRTTYDPEVMFEQLSEAFQQVLPLMRRSMEKPIRPNYRMAIYIPPEAGFLRLGRTRSVLSRVKEPEKRPYDFSAIEALLHQTIPFGVICELNRLPETCDTLIVLPENVEELTPEQQADLKAWLKPGRKLLAGPGLQSLFIEDAKETISPETPFIVSALDSGTLLIADLNIALRTESSAAYQILWEKLLHRNSYSSFFQYSVPWRTFWYNLTGKNQDIALRLEPNQKGILVNLNAYPQTERSSPGILEGSLPHHTFAMIQKENGL